MNKGFTLIELLAVIVILAIISLIATPIVLNIINDAKITATKNSVSSIASAAKTYYSNKKMNKESFLKYSNIYKELNYNGKKFDEYLYYGYGVYINDNGEIALALAQDKKCYIKQYNDSEIIVKDFNLTDCTILDSSIERWDGTTQAVIPVNNIYKISNGKELAWLSEQVQAGNSFLGKQVELISDINMGAYFDKDGNLLDDESKNFVPIGTDDTIAFKGNFNGNNHRIYNLYTKSQNRTGLFGDFQGTSFRNLILENSYLESVDGRLGIIGRNPAGDKGININNVKSINNIFKSNGWVGGIIGQQVNSSGSSITNCYSNSKIINTGGNSYVGGIVGVSSSSIIKNNINTGDIEAPNASIIGGIAAVSGVNSTIEKNVNYGKLVGLQRVAGIVNLNSATLSHKVLNNTNYGDIVASSYGIGGIIGNLSADHSNTTVIGNNNYGTVTGEVKWIGGIIGLINTSTTDMLMISSNINYGNVNSTKGAFRIAGITGNSNPGSIYMNNANYGFIDGVGDGTASSYGVGGIIGSLGSNSKLYNNINKGTIKSKQSAGGLVGNLYENSDTYQFDLSTPIIEGAINEGNVISTQGFAGGIIGVYGDGAGSSSSLSDFISSAYNSGTIEGLHASGLVGKNIGIKNSISVGTLNGNNNYGIIGPSTVVNVINTYYLNTYSSNYGTSILKNSIDDELLRNLLGDRFNISNSIVSLKEIK